MWLEINENLSELKKISFACINRVLDENQPDYAVKKALKTLPDDGRKLHLIAVGKAGWTMANAAYEVLGDKIEGGIVITKYGHSKGNIGNFKIFEAGHPILDENSISATNEAISMAKSLGADDRLIFLVSGGGSALFESSNLSLDEYKIINKKLLDSGLDIIKMNCLRKHISLVKGGRFALLAYPAKITGILLSDIVSDRIDCIASGPVTPDKSTREEAIEVVKLAGIEMTESLKLSLSDETPKHLDNSECQIIGSVKSLVNSASDFLQSNGFKVFIKDTQMTGEASEKAKNFVDTANKELSLLAPGKYAWICGGETTVTISDILNPMYPLKGGRNQEFVFSVMPDIEKFDSAVLFSLGSDGTDGPTDAAGGIIDNKTFIQFSKYHSSDDYNEILRCHDSYDALNEVGGLLFTGPTGTNVNDLAVLLVEKK